MYTKLFVGSPRWFEHTNRKLKKHELFYLILDLPFRCNFDCPKCYRKGSEYVEFENAFMEVRKKTITEAAKLGAKTIAIAGEGEPLFFWSQIKELVEFNNSLNLITNLYTNGALLNKERTAFLYEHNVSLTIALDSLESEAYGYLTGGGSLKKVLPNLEEAKVVYSVSVPRSDKVDTWISTRLAFITIVSEQNRCEIEKIHKWVGDDVYHIVNFMVDKGAASENWDVLTGGNVLEHSKIANTYTDTGAGGLSAPTSHGGCAAIYNGLTIDVYGRVIACPASTKTEVGNINNSSVSEIIDRARDNIKKIGSPVCIARDVLIGETAPSEHDGIIGPHLTTPIIQQKRRIK